MVGQAEADCPLCREDGGLLIARHGKFRIIRATGVDAVDFPACYRVIWNAHVAEWTDLAQPERDELMQVVARVESVLREQLRPSKINLASLGNMVPHLHWHVIARFDWDSRWPAPVWAPAARAHDEARLAELAARLAACDSAIAALAS